ncbi:OLC1v1004447C1 [Oldenlandia corymbosa var. corymbosa]|uniref:OLC1v1004447C1 n=1 Tax=Oldenlandia corymbosa var. corymbosa TaxID=529605 RepID=A0AAV1DCK6_OLDCO|nr:OLC1v1004447C1 [Oldenlandia corymbosa var. corymbosa]
MDVILSTEKFDTGMDCMELFHCEAFGRANLTKFFDEESSYSKFQFGVYETNSSLSPECSSQVSIARSSSKKESSFVPDERNFQMNSNCSGGSSYSELQFDVPPYDFDISLGISFESIDSDFDSDFDGVTSEVSNYNFESYEITYSDPYESYFQEDKIKRKLTDAERNQILGMLEIEFQKGKPWHGTFVWIAGYFGVTDRTEKQKDGGEKIISILQAISFLLEFRMMHNISEIPFGLSSLRALRGTTFAHSKFVHVIFRRIRILNSMIPKHFCKFTTLMHGNCNITTTKKLSLTAQQQKCTPIGKLLQSLTNLMVPQYVKASKLDFFFLQVSTTFWLKPHSGASVSLIPKLAGAAGTPAATAPATLATLFAKADRSAPSR